MRFLADENFNGDILRALSARKADMDVMRVQDVGLSGKPDREILAWAADNGRILLTHDSASLPTFAYERMAQSEVMPGVFVLSETITVAAACEEVLLMLTCSEQAEWNGRVAYLPL